MNIQRPRCRTTNRGSLSINLITEIARARATPARRAAPARFIARSDLRAQSRRVAGYDMARARVAQLTRGCMEFLMIASGGVTVVIDSQESSLNVSLGQTAAFVIPAVISAVRANFYHRSIEQVYMYMHIYLSVSRVDLFCTACRNRYHAQRQAVNIAPLQIGSSRTAGFIFRLS